MITFGNPSSTAHLWPTADPIYDGDGSHTNPTTQQQQQERTTTYGATTLGNHTAVTTSSTDETNVATLGNVGADTAHAARQRPLQQTNVTKQHLTKYKKRIVTAIRRDAGPALTKERLQLTCLSSSRTRALSQGSPVKTSPLPTANTRTNSVTTATLLQPPFLPQPLSLVTAGLSTSPLGRLPNGSTTATTDNKVQLHARQSHNLPTR